MPPGLKELLDALRVEGLTVGPRELARLHQAFAAAPMLERSGLRELLACLLAKTPAERELLERLFDAWCPDLPAEWAADALPAQAVAGSPPPADAETPAAAAEPFEHEPKPRGVPRRRQILGVIAALVLSAGLLWLLLAEDPPVPPSLPPPPSDPVQVPDPGPRTDPELRPAPRAWYWQAEIRAIALPDRLAPGELLLGDLLVALMTLGLWWRYRATNPRPRALPPTGSGPVWLPLPPVVGSDTRLMAARERRSLVWNLARFAAEDSSRRLDEPATVAATVKAGGLAELRWRHARFPREVWLWCDEHCDDPALWTLAEEIRHDLSRAGLGVRRGSFAGTPERVWWRRDDRFEPARMEGHRQHALVAVLTDGTGLARALDAPLQRRRTARLLRQLRLWSRLVLVDFGPPGRLARRLRPFGLRVLAPAELPAWLGGSEPGGSGPPPAARSAELRLWAAACCLGSEPLDLAAAQRLREHLGLRLGAWLIRDLVAAAGQPGLRWPEPRRRALLSWLLGTAAGTPAPAGTRTAAAERAIHWWRRRYQLAASERVGRGNRLLPWDRSGARRRWALEDALLCLLLEPERAVPRLRALAQADPGLRDEIRARLAGLQAADQGTDEDRVRLGWRLGALPQRSQQALAWLGLGGLSPPEAGPRLPPPPRLALALGALGGIAVAALIAALVRWFMPPAIELVAVDAIHDHPTIAAQTLRLVDQARGRLVLGSARSSVSAEVAPGARVQVAWTWGPGEADNNPVALHQGSAALVYRAGTLPQPTRPCVAGWPARSLGVIAADPTDLPAKRLALRLLDSGTADQVLITPDWSTDLGPFVGSDLELRAHSRLLVILPAGTATAGAAELPARWFGLVAGDFGALAEWLAFPATKPLDAAPVRLLAHRGAMPWHGGPEHRVDAASGIDWVRVCPGTFLMGSDSQADRMADSDESPIHAVALSGYWIARTETTNAQLRRWPSGGVADGTGDMPAAEIDREQAQAFCRWAGGDLPSEAQWERAARAGTLAPWSFGWEEQAIGDYAWFGSNSNTRAHAVGGKWPNPLGLSDMHGNLWEWVRDWYGPYEHQFAVDPVRLVGGAVRRRVLRGGSFGYSPEDLRSARRVRLVPAFRDLRIGFRCARSSPLSIDPSSP